MTVERHTSVGYHTTLGDGLTVHPTRSSAQFAVLLLSCGASTADDRLAERILLKVCGLQDADESSPTCGVWPWYLEEPLSAMRPPDHNWADFIGAQLAHVVIEHADRIGDGTLARVKASLARAVRAIVRRDVTPSYTNIAFMGSAVAIAAGEALGVEAWVAFGRNKLAAVEASVEENGSFAEYNSPTYTLVAIHECERLLQLCRDPDARGVTTRLLGRAWRCVADHWHPATRQWAGPHWRTYADVLDAGKYRHIARATTPDVLPADLAAKPMPGSVVRALPCSDEIVQRFKRLPAAEVVVHERCRRGEHGTPDRFATTWLDGGASLGSFSRGHYWVQCRPVMGYVDTGGGVPAILRARVLLNGKDLASASAISAQRGPRVLSAVHFWTGAGAYHPLFGTSDTGTFEVADLRVRLSLAGPGTTLESVGDHRWRLSAGEWYAHVHAVPGMWGDRPIVWEPKVETEAGAQCAAVEAVLMHGPPRRISLRDAPLTLTFAIELSRSTHMTGQAAAAPVASVHNDTVSVSWLAGDPLTVQVPSCAVPFVW